MFTQGSYLRVLSPRTTNGDNLFVNDNGQISYKETHLPMSAKSYIELFNKSLPQHLKKKIEVVKGNIKDVKEEENSELIAAKEKIEQLQKQLSQMQQAQVGAKPPQSEKLTKQ